MPRVLTIGPLSLPTLHGDLKEMLGDQLEAVGAGIVAGERRPRPFPLTIPIHGDRADGNRFVIGNRLRRQVRALMENPRVRLEGLYLAFSPDSELNGWLLIGGGELAYAPGGIALADYKLDLTDCFKVASTRTHRSARRITAIDRRLVTTPRDTHGTLYSSDFSTALAINRAYLPANITDPVFGSTRYLGNFGTLATADGTLSIVDNAVDGEIIDFEQGETDMHKAIVKVWDRQGTGAAEASWEQVYGTDQPLTSGDVPVLENALVRVLWDATNKRWDVQGWSGSAWVTDSTVVAQAIVTTPSLIQLRATVVEWTPERGVLLVTAVQTPEMVRLRIYVTLQRGWTGPRFEIYGHDLDSVANVGLSIYSKSTGNATFQKSTGGAVGIVTAVSLGTFVGLAPWAVLLGPGTDQAVWWSVQQEALAVVGATLSSREGVTASSTTGYASVWLGIGARATAVADATAHGKYGVWDTRAVPELVARS